MFAYSWTGNDYDDAEQAGELAWQDAACRDGSGSLTGIFFSDELEDIDLAKAICGSCPLVEPCLRGAIERREPAGVWGGQLFSDGVVIPYKRRRGRPPKVAALQSPALLGPLEAWSAPPGANRPAEAPRPARSSRGRQGGSSLRPEPSIRRQVGSTLRLAPAPPPAPAPARANSG